VITGLLVWLPTALAVGPEQVTESLATYAVARCGAERAEVTWLGLGGSVPGGDAARLDWEGDPCRSRPELELRVVEQGELVARAPVRPGLQVWVEAPVAPRRVLPGEDFTPELGLVLVQDLRGNPVAVSPWRSRVNLRAGQPVTTGQVVAVPDADQGADVTLKLVRGGLVIVAPGHLADNGYLGQPVRVVNEATHVVAEGVLVREDLVHLR